MNDISLFVLLLAAVGSGWALAHWQLRGRIREQELPRDNYELPYYFSNDIPDYALDAFISAVDVNSDTLETHLTLGAIHRRRGELERAIRIHENLVRRDGLTASQVSQSKFELALDYVKAGLHDRAEEFLQELVEKSETHRVPALHLLIDLYQDEREWLKASYASNELMDYLDKEDQERLSHRRSHFYCEQAEQSIRDKDYLSARRFIKRAQSVNFETRRPAILMASLEAQLNHLDKARELLEEQMLSSKELVEESLILLKEVYKKIGKPEAIYDVLENAYRASGSSHTLLILARELGQGHKQDRLLELIGEVPPVDMGHMPVSLLSVLDEQILSSLAGSWLRSLKRSSVAEKADNEEPYQCHHCGFEAREYHWQCPSCRRWETLRTRSQLNA